MDKILLQCNKLSKYYKDGDVYINVLQNISFSVKKGETVAITGSSGSGKSTLLHLLGGLDTPSSGDVFFFGKSINQMSPKSKASLLNNEIGFIYQFHHLLPDFTLLENIAIPLLINKKKIKEILTHINNILKLVNLSHRINHYPSELSGGECQRAAIARALINNPKLILADEPTGNLDINNSDNILKLIHKLNTNQKTSFLIVTHDLRLAKRMDRQLEIYNGELVEN